MFADLEGKSETERSWIMIPICWMLVGIMKDFFKQPQASVQIKAGSSLNFLVLLIDSADSVYFCAFALF